MFTYVRKILPKLQQYSKQPGVAAFAAKTWLLVDGHNDMRKYQFEPDGVISISNNGAVTTGKWEYNEKDNCLLIDTQTANLVVDLAFTSRGVLIFTESGTDEIPFLLYDEQVVRGGNVRAYLDFYLTRNENRRYKANDLIGVKYDGEMERDYLTDAGAIIIVQSMPYRISVGDAVIINDKPAASGIYRLTELIGTIEVDGGKIKAVTLEL
jgi:hypothetical protein